MLSDTEAHYSTTGKEALAIYWCLEDLRNYISDFHLVIETDYKPLVNMHMKKNFKSKRVDTWLIHLQDLLPQIIEIKYCQGAQNVGPDYLTRYDADDNVPEQQILNAVTRSMTKQIESPAPAISAPNHLNQVQPVSLPPNIDFSWGTIKYEQVKDDNAKNIITQIEQKKQQYNFVIHEDILFRPITKRKDGTRSKVPYLPGSIINKVREAFHDHPMSEHFGVNRAFHRVRPGKQVL